MGEAWTSAQCAEHWGVKTTTWLGYVSRGQAPAPLPGVDERRRRHWDADEVRAFPRPGAGRSRSGSGPDAEALLDRMRTSATEMDELRGRQRTLLAEGAEQGVEISAMAGALGISRQTAYSWLGR